MLEKIEGVWFGRLDERDIIIIDPDKADPNAIKLVDDFLKERKRQRERERHDGRGAEVLVRKEHEHDVAV